jgi:hypothetical protein
MGRNVSVSKWNIIRSLTQRRCLAQRSSAFMRGQRCQLAAVEGALTCRVHADLVIDWTQA